MTAGRNKIAAIVLASGLAAPTLAAAPELKLNQIQIVGTAESAKLAPSAAMLSIIRMGGKKDAQALDFTQPPLAAQFDAGARALSFDIVYDPQGGRFKNPAIASMAGELLDKDYVAAMSQPGFKVMHVPDVDFKSNCLALGDCLAEAASWTHAHPDHMPIVIILHCTDSKTPIPGAATPMPFDPAAAAALDAEIRAHFSASQILTPAMVRGAHASLREAVTRYGWPALRDTLGKVIFVLDEDPGKAGFYSADPGRPAFATMDEASLQAGFVSIEDPVAKAARITADVRLGFIVLTRADSETVEARANDTRRRAQAFASGAQIILTDFLLPDKKISDYQVSIPDSRHARCDSINASCAAWDAKGQRTATSAR